MTVESQDMNTYTMKPLTENQRALINACELFPDIIDVVYGLDGVFIKVAKGSFDECFDNGLLNKLSKIYTDRLLLLRD